MPEMKNYKVTQTREVYVTANKASDAVVIAQAAFEHGQMRSEPSVVAGKGPEGVWGNTVSRIEEVSISVEKKKLGER